MALSAAFITFEELLEEEGATESDNIILERIKLVAQEQMPTGWTSWKVTQLTKEQVFGAHIDPQVLNKLRFALPTDELAKAFDPDATHLSEKSFREIKMKSLDWAFTRALITSPPAICNKIRGSAAATEIFNRAIGQDRPMSRKEADRALSMDREVNEPRRHSRKRQASICSSTEPKKSRIEALEQKMDCLFNVMMQKIENLGPERRDNDRTWEASSTDNEGSVFERRSHMSRSRSPTSESWHAPPLDQTIESEEQEGTQELDFLPIIKETEPLVPAPSAHIRSEGVTCQRFGSESWDKIIYKDVEKRLQATPVFSALKVNAELSTLGVLSPSLLVKQDQVLGTITHGLLCQRKALAEDLKKLAKKFPEAAGDIKNLVSEESAFKKTSDDLLQFVCAHRSETIEFRRKNFSCNPASNTPISFSLIRWKEVIGLH